MSAATYALTRLPNGATITTATMPHMESVSVGVWARVGARHEPARQRGIAHFTEHLLFKGTRRRSARKLMLDVEGIGGSIDAFTTHDHTCYYLRGPRDKFKRLATVLLDMYCDAAFPAAEIDRERDVIEEEIVMYREQPSQHLDDLLAAATWPRHPLGELITGTPKTLGGLGRADFVRFRDDYYGGGNTVIAVAGNIQHEDAVNQLAPLVASLARGRKPRTRRFDPARLAGSAPRLELEAREMEQTHLALGFLACHRKDDARFALHLLNVILGENMSSRLFTLLREKHGYCYQVQSEVHLLEDTGVWQLYAGLDATKTRSALKLIGRELRRAAATPPSSRELGRARDYRLARSRMALETTTKQMMWIGESVLWFNRVVDPEEPRTRLAAVTADEVQELAATLFDPKNLSLAAIGPEKAITEPALHAALPLS